MSGHVLEKAFEREVIAARLIGRGEGVVAAVSGGADSMALLHLLVACNLSTSFGCRIVVAHLDHGLRGVASAADAAFVAGRARALGLPCVVEKADVAGEARRLGLSLETAGRRLRLAFLERVCRDSGARVAATGHHADDQVETILHRLIRGTGLRGLSGIPVSRPLRSGSPVRLVRPLLRFSRDELRRYLQDRGLPWREDVSNQTADFTRNRLRLELLPLLRGRYNPRIDEALLRLAAQARMAEQCLSGGVRKLLKKALLYDEAGRTALDRGVLAEIPEALRWRLIRAAALRAGVREARLGYERLAAAVRLIDAPEEVRTHLPGGWRLVRRGDCLVFEPPEAPGGGNSAAPVEPVPVAEQGATRLPAFGVELIAELLAADGKGPGRGGRWQGTWPAEEWLDADCLDGPLVARSRRPGDRFRPLGMPGSKKLSDFFIDEKIPVAERDRACLLCDRKGPVWVVPWRIDHRVRVTTATRRVLHVVCRPLTA